MPAIKGVTFSQSEMKNRRNRWKLNSNTWFKFQYVPAFGSQELKMFMNTDKYDVTNPPLEEIDSAMYRVNLCDYPGLNGHDDVYIEEERKFINIFSFDTRLSNSAFS